LFGSYLRRKIYDDIDLMLVYSNASARAAIPAIESAIKSNLEQMRERPDITVASSTELAALRFERDNLTQVYP